MASFDRLATVTASTKRMAAVSSGLTGAMTEQIASLKCLPIDPLNAEVARSMGLEAFVEMKQTMGEGGLDIIEGDQFIVGTTTYKVRAVGEWYWKTSNTLLIVLEEAK